MEQKDDERAIKRVAIAAAVVAMLIAVYARYVNPVRPGQTTPGGFYSFDDQSFYLAMARTLARLHLPDRRTYKYGFGYPAFGAFFFRIGFHGDPFAPVDVLSFGATIGLTVVLGARAAYGFARDYAFGLGVAAGLLLTTPALLPVATVPWNTNIVLPLGLVILVAVTSRKPISNVAAATIGLSVGWIFASRYIDALFFGVPILASFAVRSNQERRRLMLLGGSITAAIVTLVLLSQYRVFGNPFTTPYHTHLRQGFGNDQSVSNYQLRWIPSHFWGTFVRGKPSLPLIPSDPIFRQLPLLPLAPIGAVLLIRKASSRTRWIWLTAIVASSVSALFYLSFVAGGADDLKFGSQRYWAVWYPLWSVLSLLALSALVTEAARGFGRWTRRSAPQQQHM